MISTIPEGAHTPKVVALKSLDIVTNIKNQGYEPKALISRLGWGSLAIYKSSLGTRKLELLGADEFLFSNDVIYRKYKSFDVGDWYVLKVWYRFDDDGLRLRTYAVGDCGNNNTLVVDLHEV